MRNGLLIINLGTPKATSLASVCLYLAEFLTDKRVIDLPAPIRYFLVYALILPFRTHKSARAYQAIWTEEGSPLLSISRKLHARLQKDIGTEYKVALGMRYGTPSIASALAELKDCSTLTVLPLYPQYSSAATGSSLEETMKLLAKQVVIPSLKIISEFYQHPAYIKAQAQVIKPYLGEQDHLLFSYHGIPERHLTRSGCTNICTGSCPSISDLNSNCYKAQCEDTSRKLAVALNLQDHQYSTAYQSRLGKTPWIKPYTDQVLVELAAQGVRHLAIACPSFVADCLETLEELAIRAKEQWISLGGTHLTVIPCMNDDPAWVKAIIEIIK